MLLRYSEFKTNTESKEKNWIPQAMKPCSCYQEVWWTEMASRGGKNLACIVVTTQHASLLIAKITEILASDVKIRHFSIHWGSKMMKEKKSDSTFKLINMLPGYHWSGNEKRVEVLLDWHTEKQNREIMRYCWRLNRENCRSIYLIKNISVIVPLVVVGLSNYVKCWQ